LKKKKCVWTTFGELWKAVMNLGFHTRWTLAWCRQTPIQHHCLFTEVCGNKSKYCTSVMEFLFTDFHGNYIKVCCQGFDYNSDCVTDLMSSQRFSNFTFG
jgi:hypothetical protein